MVSQQRATSKNRIEYSRDGLVELSRFGAPTHAFKRPNVLSVNFDDLQKWWATLESNQAWVTPRELQSPATPCGLTPNHF